ncbi:RHS repeat-associated core domain-containing protein [Variovorax guangxiensis]|uniref:RHS repeat-associated core domain-containing protein n=1 Tax=Variovorax guangxiensis TaxID=1775474 RepID=UPI0014044118|nr:RHS repeat-associated core domain-containing protein [Variovorax guangxiensis]
MSAWGVELVRNNIAWNLKVRNSDGSVSDALHSISSFKTASCPKGYGFPTEAGWVPSKGAFGNATLENACFTQTLPATKASNKMCQAGAATPFPILPASGEKYRSESDFVDSGPAPLNFSRVYRSEWGMDPSRSIGVLDKAWTHGHALALMATPPTNPTAVSVIDAEGTVRAFLKDPGTATWSALESADTLAQNGNGSWTYRRADDDATLNFASNGKLSSLVSRNGWSTTYTYNATGQLSTIANGFGRSLSLAYGSGGQLSSITMPDQRVIAYAYDAAGRLSVVTYPDGKTRGFLYENAAFPHALTGLLDESGARFATFTYDSQGRAIDSALAGAVDRYQVSYPSNYSATVTDPLGTVRTYGYETRGGELTVGQSSLPSETGGKDAASRRLGTAGLLESETDFKGIKTSFTWDTIRRLPLSVERASGKPEALITTTEWHSTFRLPVRVTGGGLSTTYAYDSIGNLLSRTVTDNLASRNSSWSWTYNAQQLVSTATEPNGAVTQFTYDARGNVLTSTNGVGHITSFTYDTANRIVSRTEPNGLVTTYTYDLRDRLLTQTVGGQTTALTYKPFGSVETVALPTGLVLTYTYDAAHRLTGWSSNRGESGTYTLDGMGNRTAEQIKDSTGNVAWSVARTINNINRPSGRTEGPNQTSSFGYDANGELTTATDGMNQSTRYTLDNLRRLQSVTDAANASATLWYNRFGLLANLTDFNGVSTTRVRDGRGNVTKESSSDIGEILTVFDDLGLPSKITDALGQATTITRDALGRPTSLVFADGKTITLRYDLSANSKGYLSEIIDRSGTTEYTRDAFGRVTLKKQTLANGSIQQVSYAYNPNGTLASIGYPNGGTLSHSYDATGRLTGLNWNGTPLVSGIAWNPLGQPTAWTWAFTTSSPQLAASRSYDTAGRLTTTEFSSYAYDAAGRITSLMQNLWQPGDTDPTHSTIANANITWSVGYNAVGRITSFNATGNTAGFGYDANGNRSSSTRGLNGQTTDRTYTVGSSSNRLSGFTQTINGASNTSVTYGYNANGDLLTDGLRSYTYDAEGRLAAATTGATDVSPTTRYAHNALGQRVFKTEPLYPPSQGDEADPGFMASLIAFFTKLWSPTTATAEQLGYAYIYDEQGTLIAEVGSGGTNSAGQSQYIYLPTANGPMPIVAFIDGATYAVHSDHLNTPRKLSNADGQAVWQWGYSAFGEDKPTTAKNRFANTDTTSNPGTTGIGEVRFNLRYPGQYADEESGLFYNGFRTYSPAGGFYTQNDPIGLDGGWNRRIYANANPLGNMDPLGLQVPMPPPPMPIPGVPNPVLDGNKDLADRLSRAFEGNQEKREKTYQTYTRYNPLTGQCYTGRTSGYGTPEENVKNRGYGQPLLNAEGFLPGVVDRSSTSYNAIRGREQQVMDLNGGAQSSGGDSRNKINGISPANVAGPLLYIPSANREFGAPVPAGKCTCQ